MTTTVLRIAMLIALPWVVAACSGDTGDSSRVGETADTSRAGRIPDRRADTMVSPPVDTMSGKMSEREKAGELVEALPEVVAWSKFIAHASAGKAHGMTMVDRDTPEEIDGARYIAIGFYEDHPDHVVRWETFLVNPDDGTILVEDILDGVMTLERWRQEKRPMERIEK